MGVALGFRNVSYSPLQFELLSGVIKNRNHRRILLVALGRACRVLQTVHAVVAVDGRRNRRSPGLQFWARCAARH